MSSSSSLPHAAPPPRSQTTRTPLATPPSSNQNNNKNSHSGSTSYTSPSSRIGLTSPVALASFLSRSAVHPLIAATANDEENADVQRRNPLNNNKMAPTPVASSAFYVSPQRRLFVEEDESTLDDDDDDDDDDNTRARLEVAEQARNRLEKDFTDVLALLSERMREVEQLRKERDELRKERDQERDDNAILKGEHRDFWSRMQSAIKTMRLAIHEARTELDWFRSLGLLSWGTGEDDEDVSLCVSDDGHSDPCWWK